MSCKECDGMDFTFEDKVGEKVCNLDYLKNKLSCRTA